MARRHFGDSTYEQLMQEARRLATSRKLLDAADTDLQNKTLGDLFTKYWQAQEARLTPATARRTRRTWEMYILPALCDDRQSQVTRDRVHAFHLSLRDTPALANKCIDELRHAFGEAERWQPAWRLKNSNPAADIDRYPCYPRSRVLSEAEYARLGRALARARAEELHPERHLSAIELMIFTGCRPGEAQQLRWEWIEIVARESGGREVLHGRIHLPTNKKDRDGRPRGRTIWLNAEAIAVLRRQERVPGNAYVFPKTKDKGGEAGHIGSIAPAWRTLRALADLPGTVPYSLRHSFITEGDAAEVDLGVMKDLAGHEVITTTAQVYRKGKQRVAEEAMWRMGQHIGRLLKGEEAG